MNEKSNREPNRRAAISSGLAVVAGGVLTAKSGIADELKRSQRGSLRSSSHFFREEMWGNLVGRHFDFVEFTDKAIELKLRRISFELIESRVVRVEGNDPARPKHLRTETVSLLFRGPDKFELPSVSYRLYHDATGKIDLLLSHTRSKRYPDQNIYEAILN